MKKGVICCLGIALCLLLGLPSIQSATAVTYGKTVEDAPVKFSEVLALWLDPDQAEGNGLAQQICTATLIEERIALTAAHCVQGVDGDLYVEIGARNLGSGEFVKIDETWRHPRYSRLRFVNDVALLHLSRAPQTHVKPAALNLNSRITSSSRLTLAGWGLDQNGDPANRLRMIQLRLDIPGGLKSYGKSLNLSTTLPAGRYFPIERVYGGACNGDSGGPLFMSQTSTSRNRTIVGVVSFGSKICDFNSPTIFSRVDYYSRVLRKAADVLKIRAKAREQEADVSRPSAPPSGSTNSSNTTTTAQPKATTTTSTTTMPLTSTTTTTPPVPSECNFFKRCKIGDTGPGGGIVFYDAGSRQSWGRYLEAAPKGWAEESEDPLAVWGCAGVSITGALGREVGTGRRNTDAIVSACADRAGAAAVAESLALGLFDNTLSDWFLPSSDEAKLMHDYFATDASFSRDAEDYYWTSTEAYPSDAIVLTFTGGGRYPSTKTLLRFVRPIRAF